MFIFNHSIRVRYAETDQMGYVYYGNYATYYEVVRAESLRSLGLTYKEVEEAGVIMPVLRNSSLYIRPARYDDLLEIKVFLKALPQTRVTFFYEFYIADALIHTGETTLVFVNKETFKPCKVPKAMEIALKPFFDAATD